MKSSKFALSLAVLMIPMMALSSMVSAAGPVVQAQGGNGTSGVLVLSTAKIASVSITSNATGGNAMATGTPKAKSITAIGGDGTSLVGVVGLKGSKIGTTTIKSTGTGGTGDAQTASLVPVVMAPN